MVYLAYGVIYAIIFLVGICIGSFLNVLIYRIPQKINIAKGRSFCPNCRKTIPYRDLVPLISYCFLRGSCRFCGEKISARYPLVETLGGVLGLVSVFCFGLTWQAAVAFAVGSVLLAVTFIDIDTMEIPDSLIIALAVLAVCGTFVFTEIPILARVIGFFVISLPMLLMNFIIKDSFGGGDIKLCAVCGWLLGWKSMLVGGFIALLLGGGYGICLMLSRKKNRKEHFAFGPFLSLGIIIALLVGNVIWESYLNLFNI